MELSIINFLMHSKKEILEKAYSFFPKGIRFEDEQLYKNSKEFKNLLQKIKEGKKLISSWNNLVDYLKKKKLEIEFIGFEEKYQRDFRAAIVLYDIERYYIVVNVSKIIPFYCFYTATKDKNIKFSQSGFFIFSEFTEKENKILQIVKEGILIYFKQYKMFPANRLTMVAKDIEFQELGRVEEDVRQTNWYSPLYEEMIIFNAFFATNIFY